MTITAQDLDRRITIQRATVTQNELNEDVKTWADLATIWARRRDVSDGEKEAAGQVGASLMTRFMIRSSSQTRDIKPTDQIIHDDREWNIRGIKEANEGRHRFIEITAVTDLDNGNDSQDPGP
jgi:SPP1 family predicted phage head-tail adaptor